MIPAIERWFESRGWEVFDFQREAWRAYLDGRCGLIHAPTGTGKTYGAWLGPVIEALEAGDAGGGLRVLWITPLRALASDIAESLRAPLEPIGLGWRVEIRTGDTSSTVKSRQRKRLPEALVTTPESLTILLSHDDGPEMLRSVRCAVVDEWHELLSSKRGVQTELALSRLRAIAPNVRTWGLSATMGNIDEAARALVGTEADTDPPAIVRGNAGKDIAIDTLLPERIERFPWTGHIGTRLAERVLERIQQAGTTLLFTNTRSQAEIWFRTLTRMAPDMLGQIALHHGSIDREIRHTVEDMLRGVYPEGMPELRCVVCTSSLDLGVDFTPVDQVIQVGSPKGVARLIQRAGRSGHAPGKVSRIVCVPSHALELVEFAAARDRVEAGAVEERPPLHKPMDVLAQHIVTAAMGGGFDEDGLLREVRSTNAYRDLTDGEWSWALDFAGRGGPALETYPDYARITRDGDLWRGPGRKIAMRHRMGIGTIVADDAVLVKYGNGRTLGAIEESFISRLRVGDTFVFAGRVLELKRMRGMTATVARAKRASGAVPRWQGGRMQLSSQLAGAVRARLDDAIAGRYEGAEMNAVRPVLEVQKRLSRIPAPDELLVESFHARDGHHVFLYPFAGRLAHEGLGAVLSHRLSAAAPVTIRATSNDYGIELYANEALELDEATWRRVLSPEGLVDDMLGALNASEMARRAFREIARVAGLTHQGYPGERRGRGQLQASSDLFYDVFREFDPGNLLLSQAQREVVEGQLDVRRLRAVLEALGGMRLVFAELPTLSPLSFPLFVESLRSTIVSSQQWSERVAQMALELEEELEGAPG